MHQARAVTDLLTSEPQTDAQPVQLEALQDGSLCPRRLGHAVIDDRASQVGDCLVPDDHEPQGETFAQSEACNRRNAKNCVAHAAPHPRVMERWAPRFIGQVKVKETYIGGRDVDLSEWKKQNAGRGPAS